MIREVSARLIARRGARSADAYRHRIAERLFRQFEALGMPEAEQDEAVGAFFNAVDEEMWRGV